MARDDRRTDPVHASGVSREQRARGAALLIGALLLCAPAAAQTFDFDPTITQGEFDTLTRLASEAIFASPVDPPAQTGLFNFEIGLAVSAVEVDESAAYWAKSVSDDILVDGKLLVPRLVVTKGLGLVSVSGTYGKVGDSDASVLGGSVDVPLLRGGVMTPALAVRGTYSVLQGVDEADLTTYGVQALIGKGFGPLTPYAGYGRVFAQSEARIDSGFTDPILLESDIEQDVITVGGKLDLAFLKLVVEGNQGDEEWRWGARVAIGF
ncbi:MAG TPA: hypothetical protein VLV48_08815 [Thermoanaerobaculia bacterium]|nr:hypothetical protein [Thermoanaerobaculia bacterium]